VFRALNESGGSFGDLIGLADEGATTVAHEFKPAPAQVATLLERSFSSGHRLVPRPTLSESRERLLESMAKLDQRYKDLEKPEPFPVKLTAALNAMLISERLRAEKRQD
jgi:hypothetical protein